MFIFPDKHFEKLYWSICSLVLIIVTIRCIYVPFSHDEVATFNFYIQSGSFLPFLSHADANGHFLMSASSWVFFKLVGSSPLALRIPCIMAFVVLCYGIFKLNKLLPSITTKLVLTSAFIFSFNFISFYSLCRGYGMSVAFLTLALYYFFVFKRYGAISHFLKFLLFSQIALSANLTLVFVVGISTFLLLLLQYKNKGLYKLPVLFAIVWHLALLFFWIKYAFYLKESGSLYYGSGDSYWEVTFKTLIETVLFKSQMANVSVVTLFSIMIAFFLYKAVTKKTAFLFESSFSVSLIILCSLILVFFLLKLFLGVNYPEDRTGLFFYVFFVLSVCFMLCEFDTKIRTVFLLVPLFFLSYFMNHLNFRVHPWRVYETMPVRFFETLIEEQHKADHRITIGGHRVREFFYAFLNYKSSEKLNHMTSPEALQMNCDYAIAYKQDKPWYDKYYDELDEDTDWDFRLIKRKVPLVRNLVYSNSQGILWKGLGEYYNAFEKTDTTFNFENPLCAEFELSVKEAPEPFNAWLVLQIDDANDETNNSLLRIPLNLVKFSWNGTKQFTLSIVTGKMPLKIKRIVAYLWNMDKKQIEIKLNAFNLYELKGEGVNQISKAKI
jgi:hypothetical protein